MDTINNEKIRELSSQVRNSLKETNDFEINPIDTSLDPVAPFVGGDISGMW